MTMFDRALRMGEGKKFKVFERNVARINDFEPELELESDDELRARYEALRARALDGESLDELLFEAFALLRRERPGLRLVLTGGGHEGRHVPPGVEVRGLVPPEELVSLLRRAAALVFPSLYDCLLYTSGRCRRSTLCRSRWSPYH